MLSYPFRRNEKSFECCVQKVIGSRRDSWTIISFIQQKEEHKGNENNVKVIKEYKKTVQTEISGICKDGLNLLDDALIPSAQKGESTVFFLKMKGYYHRYYAEIDAGNDQKNFALDAYTKASEFAHTTLAPTHTM